MTFILLGLVLALATLTNLLGLRMQASEALDSFTGAVISTLKKGDTVTLVGFGTFSVSQRAARTGRNPQTGEALKIKAAKVGKFKPGKDFKDKIAGVKAKAKK